MEESELFQGNLTTVTPLDVSFPKISSIRIDHLVLDGIAQSETNWENINLLVKENGGMTVTKTEVAFFADCDIISNYSMLLLISVYVGIVLGM